VAGTVTFTPGLLGNGGTLGGKERVTAPLNLGSCSGGTPAQTTATWVVTAKIKGNTKPKRVVDSCNTFYSVAGTTGFVGKIKWGAKAQITKTLGYGATPTSGGSGELGFNVTGTATGSYAGPDTVHVIFDQPSSTALSNCLQGKFWSSVSTLTIDSSASTATVGVP
jgi:hypothetical protein